MNLDRIPVIIGASEVTEREPDLELASSPMQLMLQAVHQAADHACIDRHRLADLDTVTVVRSMFEFTRNSPEVLACRLGANRATRWITPLGGNMPQYLVNRYAEEIANGKSRFVLLAGTEAMATSRKFIKATGNKPDWNEPSDRDAVFLLHERPFATAHEKSHDFWQARHIYPLFENALRAKYGHSIEEHQMAMGRLLSSFSEVAAENPKAWYPVKRSAEEIALEGHKNRMVSWPYTKYMNAMNQVNQSATVLMTSTGFARELGVPEERWVYLHGCADANEKWHVTERQNYYSSSAIRTAAQKTFGMAGKSAGDMDYLDLYACFPVAVEIARDELGIAVDDPRPLTITGGLPYYGGAGSYVMSSIAAMANKLQKNPGKYGLIVANGGYMTELAVGIYSTEPSPQPSSGDAPWQRVDPALYQADIDALPCPRLIEEPCGDAVIETYTVSFGRDSEPDLGLVIGRLGDGSDHDAPRFISKLPLDKELLTAMTKEDYLGAPGKVVSRDQLNTFIPA